jgi:hypothetical protein
MEGKHVKDLMEAYLEMYAPKEEIEEGKSSRPRYPGGRGVLDQERRDEKREASAENMRGHTAGAGTVTKNPKKLRKQKAMGELGEAVKGESSDRRKALAAERRAGIKPLSAKEGEKYASHKISQMAYAKRAKMGEELDIFDVVLEFLQAEGYAETLEEAEWMMANVIDEEAIAIITELTGGKGHPGYKAGSKDHGPMQSGHPADSTKRMIKGGTMSQRHGYHLGDMDDDDDDDDDLESIVKQQSRHSRERARKPLRDKVKAARKVLSKEDYVSEASRRDEFTRAAIARNSGKKGGITFEPGPNWDASANRGKGAHISPKQKEKQRRKALRQEDFELWVNSLVEEGYDLSDYSWDEMYEFYLDEAITSEKGKAKAAEMIAKRTTASGRAKPGQGANVATIKHIGRSNRDGLLGTPPNRKVAGSNWPKSYTGIGGTGNKAARRAAALRQEEYMDEAQAARENPEKYEREQEKKSAPVRGERTPMPPRGDKRREDFEKWYAKNVR